MSVMQALEGMGVVGKAVTQMFLHDEPMNGLDWVNGMKETLDVRREINSLK